MADKVKVGMIGCGNISPAYFNGCKPYDLIEIAAVADLNLDLAKARAQEFNVPKACTPEQLLADPDIKIVLNLTVPKAPSTFPIPMASAAWSRSFAPAPANGAKSP